MKAGFLATAEMIARSAQRKRLQQIAQALGDRGLGVEVHPDSVVIKRKRIMEEWLRDPLLRFAGRYRR